MIFSKKKKTVSKTPAKKTTSAHKPTPAQADKMESDAGEKKRGRPKGSTTKDKGPLGKAGVSTKRKTPDDIKDTRDAIKRYRDDINKLVKREKDEHPGSLVVECPDLFAIARREPIDPEFFATTLQTAMLPIFAGLDVMSVFPKQDHFDRLGRMWSEASMHFDFGRWCVLVIALLTTVGTVGGGIVFRIRSGPDGDHPERTGQGVGKIEEAHA